MFKRVYRWWCPDSAQPAPPRSSEPHTHWGPTQLPATLTWQRAAPGRGRALCCWWENQQCKHKTWKGKQGKLETTLASRILQIHTSQEMMPTQQQPLPQVCLWKGINLCYSFWTWQNSSVTQSFSSIRKRRSFRIIRDLSGQCLYCDETCKTYAVFPCTILQKYDPGIRDVMLNTKNMKQLQHATLKNVEKQKCVQSQAQWVWFVYLLISFNWNAC